MLIYEFVDHPREGMGFLGEKDVEESFGTRPDHGREERHDLDPTDWYMVRDGKMFSASVYPRQVQQAIAQGLSRTPAEAKARAKAKAKADAVWGPQGNFAGDKPVNIGTTVTKKPIKMGQLVKVNYPNLKGVGHVTNIIDDRADVWIPSYARSFIVPLKDLRPYPGDVVREQGVAKNSKELPQWKKDWYAKQKPNSWPKHPQPYHNPNWMKELSPEERKKISGL